MRWRPLTVVSVPPNWRWLAAALVASVALPGAGAWWLWRAPPPFVSRPDVPADIGAPLEVQVFATAAPMAAMPALVPSLRETPSRARSERSIDLVAGGDVSLSAPPDVSAGEPSSGLSREPAAAAAQPTASGAQTGPSVLSVLASRLAAAALRCYPAAAVRFRLRGEALLAFCLREDGASRSVSLVRSSGSPLLDRAALECVLPGALPV